MGRDGQVSALALFSEELRRARSAAGLTQDQLAGQVVERPGDVARVALLYDILRAEALSPRASADLARKAIEQWT